MNLLSCHHTLIHLKPEDMQKQNQITSSNLPKSTIPPTLHSHSIHLSLTHTMLATDSVSKYNTPLSLSLSVLHSQTHLAHPMFSVSDDTARIPVCSTVINGLRVLKREQISVLCFIIFNLHPISHAVQPVPLPPFSTHNISRHSAVLQPDTLRR